MDEQLYSNDPLWYKDAVFYEVYIRAFYDSDGDGHGDLKGLTQKLEYLQDLGVDCLWLLPIYPSPLKDDGYDIADYYNVIPRYGNLEDFRNFIDAAHARGLKVITDLVLNHTSDQHPWFQAAKADRNSPYRDYYVWSDTPDTYSQARIIFLDTEDSNWAWDENTQQYYWHRFYSSQPDLNFANPLVREEMKQVMKFWLDLGVDGFRADAVPYLFEREGTNCENLPETHVYLKEIRAYLDEFYPGRILLAEANQWPEDVRPYFGDGDEFHMGFHFPVMPRIFMALKTEDRTPIQKILARTPNIPDNCQWCIFLRNHDELTLEMVTEEERQWMWEHYAPEARMRLNLGIRRRLAPLLDNDRRRLELVNSLLFTLPGSPILYYGDEIGMGDNIWLFDRNGVRTPMQWSFDEMAGFSTGSPESLYAPVIKEDPYGPEQVNVMVQRADPDSLYNLIRKMIMVRRGFSCLGRGDLIWIDDPDTTVAAYLRRDENDELLVVQNLSARTIQAHLPLETWGQTQPRNVLTNEYLPPLQEGHLELELAPYQFLWLVG